MTDAWIEHLSLAESVSLLRESTFGRIAFLIDDYPVVLPVNFRLATLYGRTWIAIRTRPGNVIDHQGMKVAFEADGADSADSAESADGQHRQGWSVLVRGTLQHVDPDVAGIRERFDSEPWLSAERDAWLIVEPYAITGRRLGPRTREWAFHMQA